MPRKDPQTKLTNICVLDLAHDVITLNKFHRLQLTGFRLTGPQSLTIPKGIVHEPYIT